MKALLHLCWLRFPVAVWLLAAAACPAATFYWDLNGAAFGAGATPTGTWDTVSANWNSGRADGDNAPEVWDNTSDRAVFSAGTDAVNAFTVTVVGTQSPTRITFEEGSPTLTGGTLSIGTGGMTNSTSGTTTISSAITLAGAQTWRSSSGNTFTVNGNVANGSYLLTIRGAGDTLLAGALGSGSGGLTKTDAGTLTLSGGNSYTGTTTVNAGVLNLQNSSALGGTGSGTTVGNGATLQLQNGIGIGAEALTIRGTGVGGAGALRNISGDNTYGGPITLNAATRINSDSGTLTLDVASGNAIAGTNRDLTLGGAGTIIVADPIATGSGTLTKDGGGTLTLSAANTYTGTTTVSGGTLQIAVTDALPTGTDLTVQSGATFKLNGYDQQVANLTDSGGTVELDYKTLTVDGSVSFAGASTVAMSLDGTTPGNGQVIAGAGGSGSLALGDGTASLSLSTFGTFSAETRFWLMLNNDAAGSTTGYFAGQSQGSSIDLGGVTYYFFYNADYPTGSLFGGNDILLAVPEPSALLLLFCGVPLLLRRPRRRAT